MAGDANLLCYLLADFPGMRPVALLALQAHILDMAFVLSYKHDIRMARKTVAPVGHGVLVRLMALVAVELHRRILGDVDLCSLLDDLRTRHEIPYIQSAVSDQFLPYPLTAMTEKAFLPAR